VVTKKVDRTRPDLGDLGRQRVKGVRDGVFRLIRITSWTPAESISLDGQRVTTRGFDAFVIINKVPERDDIIVTEVMFGREVEATAEGGEEARKSQNIVTLYVSRGVGRRKREMLEVKGLEIGIQPTRI